ncbi:MAG: hypothetical protein NT025_07835 [bacterium]|nr:hypothetical protein [bacterium]
MRRKFSATLISSSLRALPTNIGAPRAIVCLRSNRARDRTFFPISPREMLVHHSL